MPDADDRTPLPRLPFVVIDDPLAEERPPDDVFAGLVALMEAHITEHGGTIVIRHGARSEKDLMERLLPGGVTIEHRPGITEHLSGNRQTRLSELRAKLRELPTREWIETHPEFKHRDQALRALALVESEITSLELEVNRA